MHPLNAQGVSGLLEFLLTGFLFIPSITIIIIGFLLSASGGISLVPKGVAGAIYFTTLALTTSNILTFSLSRFSYSGICFLTSFST